MAFLKCCMALEETVFPADFAAGFICLSSQPAYWQGYLLFSVQTDSHLGGF